MLRAVEHRDRQLQLACALLNHAGQPGRQLQLSSERDASLGRERLGYSHARWVEGPSSPQEIMKARIALGVSDVDGRPVALMRDDWELRRAQSDNPTWKFNA